MRDIGGGGSGKKTKYLMQRIMPGKKFHAKKKVKKKIMPKEGPMVTFIFYIIFF